MDDFDFSDFGGYRSVNELPEKYRMMFDSYANFNEVQSSVFDDVLGSNRSIVVAAPTGSGKTVVLELAAVKALADAERVASTGSDFKMVYVSPAKALCRERFNDWNPRFSRVGVSCVEVTGDDDDYMNLRGYRVVITTPEKWDSLTRKWRDNVGLVQLVKLFMIDEVHLLGDGKRGPVLEAIVSRMKTVAKSLNIRCVRFVAVSATICNVEDLAEWLGDDEGPAKAYKFGSEVRPVQLRKIVKGYRKPASQSAFLFDIQLSYRLKGLILDNARGKPTLVFCSTRKSVIQTAKILSEQLSFHFSDAQREKLLEGSSVVVDPKLRQLMTCGIGYHHAGMAVGDKRAVQALFAAANLPILVATSTLAVGVNLPAHLVIIKSTQQFIAGRAEEYSESAVLQMIGRAGRPQFDATATAVIMTNCESADRYERLLDSKEVIESSLHLRLPEHLNSEIVLHTITDASVAMDWMRSTYLYVRAVKNPRYYGFGGDGDPARIDKYLESMCTREMNGLQKAELVSIGENGRDVSPTAYGRLMSHYYLSFETFKIFGATSGTETMPELLSALSEAKEFSEVQLRASERKILNELNRSRNRDGSIRYPLPGKIKTRAMKVNCLVQAVLGCLPVTDPGLHNEAARLVRQAERLCKCLADFLSKKEHHGSLLHASLLAKCLHAKLWENSPFVSRQLERIGPASGALLASCGKTSFDALERSNPRDLERIVNRAPPFGNVLRDAVRHLPKYELRMTCERVDALRYRTVVTVSLLNSEVVSRRNTAGDRHWVSLVVGDTDNRLLSVTRVTDRILARKDLDVSVVSKYPNLPHKVVANLLSEQWVGIDASAEVTVVDVAARVPSVKRKKPRRSCDAIGTRFARRTKTENTFECCFDVDVVLEEDEEEEEDATVVRCKGSKG